MIDRPRIIIGALPETVDAAIEALATLDVYQRSGALVDTIRDASTRDGTIRPDGSARVRLLPSARLRECLELAASWHRRDAQGELRRAAVPDRVVASVDARGQWAHIRPLDGVVEWPVLRPDGTVQTERGYDPQTRLLCEPSVDVQVPEHPTPEDARHALERLRELVIDSPFADEAHTAAWIAALLSVLARPAIDGPVPLTLIDANTRGAGKTTLADLIGVIVTGRILARRAVPDDAAEWRKTMLAIAIAADPLLLIDNVTRLLASDALDAVLTGSLFRERILGRNEELTLPIRTVFLVTANNAMLSADLVRRALHVRLESPEEQPERRTGWTYPDLLGHAREHRAQLLVAAMTILRAYVVAGRPQVQMQPMGSYDAWSAVVRAPLVWLGMQDPAETQEGLRESADTERDAIAELLRAWYQAYGPRVITVAEVLIECEREHNEALALRHAVIGVAEGHGGRLPTARRLGKALAKLRGRSVEGHVVERVGKTNRGQGWRVRDHRRSDFGDLSDSVSNARASGEWEGSTRESHQSHHSHQQLGLGGS